MAGIGRRNEKDLHIFEQPVLRHFAGYDVLHLVADVAGLVRYALVAVGDGQQREQAFEVIAVGRDLSLERPVDVVVKQVGADIELGGLHRQFEILLEKRADCLADHRDGDIGQSLEHGEKEWRPVAAEQDGEPVHALGVVTDPFQFRADFADRVDEPEMGGHRNVAHDELHAQAVDQALQVVNARVTHNGRVAELGVARIQRLDGILETPQGKVSHLAHLVADAVDVLLHFLFQMRHHEPSKPEMIGSYFLWICARELKLAPDCPHHAAVSSV
jgi:hypothetical protein